MRKLIVIWLDGYDLSLANAMIDELPSLARIRQQSARFLLDHGSARWIGVGEEHASSGLSPNDAERWSYIFFDKETYEVWQEGPLLAPFPARMRANTVVFDFPYFDLSRASQVRGAVAWGTHHAGVEFFTNPKTLRDELHERYGVYPADQWVYGFTWPSSGRCQSMANALVEGVALRSKMALWLLKERFLDWDLALVGVSEAHSALEALWHGVDKRHPLHSHRSSRAAAEGIYNVYQAIDRLVGALAAEFEDATILIFSMHGMGANHSDVPGMVLLPELLHRHAFGRSFFLQPESWSQASNGVPILGEEDDWNVVTPNPRSIQRRVRDKVVKHTREQVAKFLPEYAKKTLLGEKATLQRRRTSMDWMPAARYRPLGPRCKPSHCRRTMSDKLGSTFRGERAKE